LVCPLEAFARVEDNIPIRDFGAVLGPLDVLFEQVSVPDW